jgi:hypothetical protein
VRPFSSTSEVEQRNRNNDSWVKLCNLVRVCGTIIIVMLMVMSVGVHYDPQQHIGPCGGGGLGNKEICGDSGGILAVAEDLVVQKLSVATVAY